MRLWFLSLAVLLFAISCGEKQPESFDTGGDAVIAGEFPELAGQKIMIKGDDYTQLIVDTIYVDDQGFFEHRIYLEKPEYFSMQVNLSKVLLYLQPHDSISVSGNINNIPGSLQYSGSSTVYNNYLVNWVKGQMKFQATKSDFFSAQENQAVRILDSLRTAQLSELESLQKNFSGIDAFFLNTEQNRILYTWAQNLQDYPRNHAYVHKNQDFEVQPEFYNYLAELDLKDTSLIHIPVYRQFLEGYVYYQMENAYKQDSLVMQKYGSFARFRMHTMLNYFENQKIRDFISYTSMKTHVRYDGIKDYETLFPYFDSICQDSIFELDILSSLEPWAHLRSGKPSKDFTYVNMEGDSVKLSDFRGDYIFIDVWATWCTPCLREIPSLQKLEKEMENNNIVFMSISVDKDKSEWYQMVSNSHFSGVQLYAGNSSILMDFYKITGIPRFILIDPEGKIVEASADRPSMGIYDKLIGLPGM